MIKFQDIKNISNNFDKEFCKAINESSEYRIAAKGWGIDFEGGTLYIFEASGEVIDNIKIFMDLKDGMCLGVKLLGPNDDIPKPAILTIKAPFHVWKKIRLGQLKLMNAIMSGHVKIEGNISLVMRYSKAAMILGNIARKQKFFNDLLNIYTLDDF
jgi:putative sterol carrier protein